MAASSRKVTFKETCEDSCKFCSKQASYTCPRCNTRYCSSDCYKDPTHAACSEQFYRECVLTELEKREDSDDLKLKTLHILKKSAEQQANDFEEDEFDEEWEVPTLEERFADIDLETDDIDADQLWSRLTDEEKKEFERLKSEHRLEELVPPWEPWWQNKVKPVLVQEVGTESTTPDIAGLPPLLKEIQSLKTIMPNSSPSPNVAYTVVNTLYAYAVTTRLHDGDHEKMCVDAADVMLAVSAALGKKQNFDDVATSACSAMKAAQELRSFDLDTPFLLTAIQDAIKIISGPNSSAQDLYVLAALCDLHILFTKASKHAKNDGQRKNNFKAAAKKVLFLLSWVKDGAQTLQAMIPHLQLLHDETATETMAQQLREHQQNATSVQAINQQKPLIEEIVRKKS